MNEQNNITAGDFQKLVAIALQSLTIQATLLENQVTETSQELRTLERDDELDKLDAQLLRVRADYDHYKTFVDPEHAFDLGAYYE